MDFSHPTALGMVCHHMKHNPNNIFRFPDNQAVIFYYRPWHTLVYLLGDFKGEPDEIIAEIYRAAASTLN